MGDLDPRAGYWKTGQATFVIELRLKGHLKKWLADYFGGLELRHCGDGSCTLTGTLPDAAAFYGLILKMRDSGVELLFMKAKRKGFQAG